MRRRTREHTAMLQAPNSIRSVHDQVSRSGWGQISRSLLAECSTHAGEISLRLLAECLSLRRILRRIARRKGSDPSVRSSLLR